MNLINEEITLDTNKDVELINIADKINDIIKYHSIDNALVNISTKHTTSAIIINEDETGLKKDIVTILEKVVPDLNYCHDRIDNNAKSHIKSLFLNSNQSLPVVNSRISLGTWQSIFFVELDGPRKNRIVNVTILY